MDTDETPEIAPGEPENVEAVTTEESAPTAAEALPPQTQLEATYHVALWTQPPSFLCLRCSVTDLTHEAILAHVATAHSLEPVPTPLAAQYLANNVVMFGLTPREEPTDERVNDGEPVTG